MDQQGKVKLFRVLKVIFYCLGLPLMFMSVLALSVLFYGEAPFAGTSWFPNNILGKVTVPMSGSAFYGVWIAAGIWLFLAAMQILFHYVIKSRKARMIAISVVILITMLVPVFVIDSSYTHQLETLQSQVKADGVVVDDYMTQLSYYRTVSSGGGGTGRMGNRTEAFINRINSLTNSLNVWYHGGSSNGTAGSYNSNPVTYAYLGIDFNKDGKLDAKDDIEILVAPTGGTKKKPGKLVLSDVSILDFTKPGITQKIQAVYRQLQGYEVDPESLPTAADFKNESSITFDGYMPVGRGKDDGYGWKEMTLWYDEGKMPQPADGVFGQADYSRNGLLGDGYIFGLDIVLNVLDMYYSAQEAVNANIAAYNAKYSDEPTKQIASFDAIRADLKKKSLGYVDETTHEWVPGLQEKYYTDSSQEGYSLDKHIMYLRETEYFKGDFELTTGKLNDVLASLGGVVGTNFLFDFLAGVFGDDLAKILNTGDTLAVIIDKAISQIISAPILGSALEAPLGDLKKTLLGDGTWKNPGELAKIGLDDAKLQIVYNKDNNKNGVWDDGDEYYDANDNKVADDDEKFIGMKIVIKVNTANKGEFLQDDNGNGQWDPGELFTDTRNGRYDEGEEYTELPNPQTKEPEPGWQPYEPFVDALNGVWDAPEPAKYEGVELNLSTNMSMNHINSLVDGLLTTVCSVIKIPRSTVDSLLGLVGGALPVDLNNLEQSIADLLQTMYWYQSPDVLPYYAEEFYVDTEADPLMQNIQRAMSQFEYADYAGRKHGTAIGAELIDKAGTVGLGSLKDVRQLKTDISYIPTMYPVLTARDMLLVFCGMVIFWTILSYICAEKEYEYETGTAPIKEKKNKKGKKGNKNSKKGMNKAPSNNIVNDNKEGTKIPELENTDKEVK